MFLCSTEWSVCPLYGGLEVLVCRSGSRSPRKEPIPKGNLPTSIEQPSPSLPNLRSDSCQQRKNIWHLVPPYALYTWLQMTILKSKLLFCASFLPCLKCYSLMYHFFYFSCCFIIWEKKKNQFNYDKITFFLYIPSSSFMLSLNFEILLWEECHLSGLFWLVTMKMHIKEIFHAMK